MQYSLDKYNTHPRRELPQQAARTNNLRHCPLIIYFLIRGLHFWNKHSAQFERVALRAANSSWQRALVVIKCLREPASARIARVIYLQRVYKM